MTLSPFKRRFKGPEFTLVLDEGQHKDGELIKIGTRAAGKSSPSRLKLIQSAKASECPNTKASVPKSHYLTISPN